MNTRVLSKYTIALIGLFLLFSCSDDDSGTTGLEFSNETSVADQILALVNQHRQNEGLSILSKSTAAEELAIEHTIYMIDKGSISHDGFGERGDELRNSENARSVAENVASSYPSAEAVMTGWLNSTGHRNNIEGNYTHIGIAAIKNENGTYYYTQLFYR